MLFCAKRLSSSAKISSRFTNTTRLPDGHLYFYDDQGYKYEMVAENKKGILTRVAITYPTK